MSSNNDELDLETKLDLAAIQLQVYDIMIKNLQRKLDYLIEQNRR